MTLEEQLNSLNTAYYEADEETPIEEIKAFVVEKLRAVHSAVMRNPEQLADFKRLAPKICGGTYLPYLFWIELVKFVDGKPDRDYIGYLLKCFLESDFDETEQLHMKPLLVIYYTKERSFELSKLKNTLFKNAHPQVKAYMDMIAHFVQINTKSVETYIHKFMLLKDYHPNFELFNLPVPRLEEHLSE